MVALGKTKDGKAFNCQSPSNLTKLREEDLYEELPFVLNIRAPAIATTLAKGEVLEMLDTQERPNQRSENDFGMYTFIQEQPNQRSENDFGG
jgi:hypothetical protein